MTATAKMKPEFDTRKYTRLLSRFVPRAIKSEEEYDRMVEIVDYLMDKGEDNLSPEEGELLELVSILIEDYDDEHYPIEKTATPLQMLEFLMEQRDVNPKDLWGVFGAKSTTSQVLSGKRELSKTHIRKLAEFFNVSADLFI
jgi:HTH-type transcriptional regulator/antitoxin HigA